MWALRAKTYPGKAIVFTWVAYVKAVWCFICSIPLGLFIFADLAESPVTVREQLNSATVGSVTSRIFSGLGYRYALGDIAIVNWLIFTCLRYLGVWWTAMWVRKVLKMEVRKGKWEITLAPLAFICAAVWAAWREYS